jgi:hypothetical protein
MFWLLLSRVHIASCLAHPHYNRTRRVRRGARRKSPRRVVRGRAVARRRARTRRRRRTREGGRRRGLKRRRRRRRAALGPHQAQVSERPRL